MCKFLLILHVWLSVSFPLYLLKDFITVFMYMPMVHLPLCNNNVSFGHVFIYLEKALSIAPYIIMLLHNL